MSELARKFAPIGMVAAMVAWCCWPYLDDSGDGLVLEEPSTLPEITATMLAPPTPAVAERDPFRPAHLAVDEPPPEELPPDALPDVEPLPQADPLEVAAGMPLEATCVQGDRRIAMIGGRVYEEGEPLAMSDVVTEPCYITRIYPHKVRILHLGRVVELTYGDPTISDGSAQPEGAADSGYIEPTQPRLP
ncbi:MAG: hypothetical protein ACYTG0_04530 [Planctomycetota bacterium]|jgi:hypothetical protein